MRYVFLLHGDTDGFAALSPDEQQAVLAGYVDLDAALREAGKTAEGAELQAPAASRLVRVRGGRAVVSDGPFAETAEQLAGYYAFDCADLDEALGWAARIPAAQRGTVEVRPVVVR